MIDKLSSSPAWQRWASILTICIATLFVFDPVLQGKLINNSIYLYAYEPWVYYQPKDGTFYNFILSDDMDAMSMSYPTAELLGHGKFSFWNRFWQLGIPEFRIDSGWFYPLRVLWVVFGIPVGMTLEVLLRFAAGGIFAFLLLEILGVAPLIALICALGYTFGSNNIGDYMYGFGPPGLTLPLVLYCVERVIRHRGTKDIVFLTLSLILLNTHIMVHVNALHSVWVGIYAALRIASERGSFGVLTRKMAIAIAFSPLLYAFALVPTLDFYLNYFNDSYRQAYSAGQLRPYTLLSLMLNKFFGEPLLEAPRYVYGSYVTSGVFIGFLTANMGVVFALLRLIFQRDKFVIITAAICFVMLMLIYETSFESAERVLGYIPLFKLIYPFYHKPIFQFFLMILGALGLDYFWKLSRKRWGIALAGLLGSAALQVVGIKYFFKIYEVKGPSPELMKNFTTFMTVHALLLIAFLLALPAIRELLRPWLHRVTMTFTALVLVGLTIYECRDAAIRWIPYSGSGDFYRHTQTTDFLQKHVRNSRVVSLDRAAVPGLLYGYNLSVAAGRSLPREPYLELLRLAYPGLHKDHPTQSLFPLAETDLTHPVWDLANVNFFVASKEIDKGAVAAKYGRKIKIHAFDDGVVLERQTKSRGAIAAYETAESSSALETKELVARGLDVKKTIVVQPGEQKPAETAACGDEQAAVRKVRLDANSFEAIVENKCPAYFAPSMFYDRGWRAFVDGKEQPIGLAYGFMPVIKIDTPGEHRVEFRYFPKGLYWGGLISVASLFLYGGALAFDRKFGS